MSEKENCLCCGTELEEHVYHSTCIVYGCYNNLCNTCRLCVEHNSIKRINNVFNSIKELYEETKNGDEWDPDYVDFVENEYDSLRFAKEYMDEELKEKYTLLQSVHNKKLPDDISKLITSFLY